MSNNNTIEQRLKWLRSLMKESSLIGYLIPSGDEFLGEFIPPCSRRLEYITGFTGSNGFAVILMNKVLFFTDGRYLEQASIQLDSRIFEIFNLRELKNFDWNKYLSTQMAGQVASVSGSYAAEEYYIGFDPRLFTSRFIEALFSINSDKIQLKPNLDNLIDKIWHDQPARPNSKVYDYPIEYAGVSRKEKIERLQHVLQDKKAAAVVITSPEEVCWLFNIRAHDLEFTPLLLSYAIVTGQNAYLFCSPDRIEENPLQSMYEESIILATLDEFDNLVKSIEGVILYDPNFASYHISEMLNSRNAYSEQTTNNKQLSSKKLPSIVQKWKAIKNETELKWMKEGHVQDGVAVIEMLSLLSNTSAEELACISEYDVSVMLTDFRTKRDGYVMDSFSTISGFRENGSVIHYRPYKESAKNLSVTDENSNMKAGLLLIDSGGQYMGSTTDITRVVMLGGGSRGSEDTLSKENAELSIKYKKFYTKVLKGHLQLAMIKFPVGNVSGANLDVLARQYLWKSGLDYGHGTGHGVGSFLSVHEGPCGISLVNSCAIESGMVLSNEPGYYVPGEFGIRIENMMYACPVEVNYTEDSFEEKFSSGHGDFLEFKMLTMVPYCRDLIDLSMLSCDEIEYLKRYYQTISYNLRHMLSDVARKWFDEEVGHLNNQKNYNL